MRLEQVLQGVKLRGELSPGIAERSVAGMEYDSRRVGKDFLFFAFAGSRVDGRRFARDAMDRGAIAVVSELGRPEGFAGAWIEVEQGRQALAIAARNFYDRVDERVLFTGVTGTNGKTTTAFLIDSIFRAAGLVTGLAGTIEYRIGDEVLHGANTTPESLDILRMASEVERRGGARFTMEVSSHALALGRVFGIRFHTAVFTNLTRDHLDFHHTMEEYAAAKRMLFFPPEGPAPEWSVLNIDDDVSRGFANPASRVVWYGLSSKAELTAEKVATGFDGLRFELRYEGARQVIESALVGEFNVMNILAAAGAGLSFGIDLETIARGVAACTAVPGRFERVDAGQPFLVAVDYAHTDDALRNAIQVARRLTSGRVITLFGCGGDRDRTKRPLMGMAAAELSDFVVLTSDNPRSEDPLDIMNDAMVGIRRFDTPNVAEPDRGKAIRLALQEARAGDVVLLAGKGHETYQVLKDRTIDFDDRETAWAVLRSLGYGKS
ncbi:MAG TPA: UDP-N-acetylmuramoyl-L-alanyl-D-glutamate--2,6-diaminopimelate ligase [Bryobacteraceae bacterium]|nr:UDP-N-acetylmuramoyl-L-alanyl-D-glutamate--2,6-diaminopimelate ligase [Bryobacteraceae bacterium]